MPQTFPGSTSAKPRSHCFSNCPREMQLTTRAATRKRVGRPSRWTRVPVAMGRGERAAHPPRFARMIWQCSENEEGGSLLVTVTGISHGIRVPPRNATFCGLEPKVPKSQGSHRSLWNRAQENFCSEFVTNPKDQCVLRLCAMSLGSESGDCAARPRWRLLPHVVRLGGLFASGTLSVIRVASVVQLL
jgi:hypothetical protein